MNGKNYRVMKFFEPVNKKDKSRGYVRLDMRGVKGNLIVAAENLGDAKSTSEVYLYKDKQNKIKLGDINNKKGIIKKQLTFGSNSAIEDYNTCAVVKDGKIVLYSNLFNASNPDSIRKLEDDTEKTAEVISSFEEVQEKEQITAKDERIKEETVEEEPIIVRTKKEARAIKEVNEVKEAKEEPSKVIVNETNQEPEEDISNASVKDEETAEAQGYRSKFDENLYKVLKEYKTVEPLSVKLKNFAWWYIPYDEKGVQNGILPYYNQIISSYYPYPMSNRVTTCAGLMKKYGHYIFGIYKENDAIARFIYGVPGEFTKEEQPYKGVTGFKNWSYGNKENKENKGSNGYWLAFVNPKTGETTDPPQI